MDNEIKQKQIELLEQLIDCYENISNELFKDCDKHTTGMSTDKSNEIFNNNYKEISDLLYNQVKEIAAYHYNLKYQEL